MSTIISINFGCPLSIFNYQSSEIEDIQSAERLLNRRSAQASYNYSAQEGRQQRALAAYQSLQQSDERAYVSQVLGIDVYA